MTWGQRKSMVDNIERWVKCILCVLAIVIVAGGYYKLDSQNLSDMEHWLASLGLAVAGFVMMFLILVFPRLEKEFCERNSGSSEQ